MLTSKFKLNQLRFDRKKFGDDIELAGNLALYEAAAAFVNAAEEALPVFTGMAKASLRPLADRVDVTLDTTPVARPKRKDGLIKTSEGNLIEPNRVALGESMGHGHLSAPRNQYGPIGFFFEYYIEVPHWAGGDNIPALESNIDQKNQYPTKEQPWRAFEAANEAFEATFQEQFERVYSQVVGADGDYLRTVEQSGGSNSSIRLKQINETPF